MPHHSGGVQPGSLRSTVSSNKGCGDVLYENLFIVNGGLLLWEQHYFALMAAMRMLRMKIPSSFSPEYLEEYILDQARVQLGPDLPLEVACRFRLWRERTGGQMLKGNEVISYGLDIDPLTDFRRLEKDERETHIYLDHRLPASLLSGLGIPSLPLFSVAEVFAGENDWADLVLLNEQKRIARSIRGVIWIIGEDNNWKTPSLEEGAPARVGRTHFMEFLNSSGSHRAESTQLVPFELNTAQCLVIQQEPFRFYLVPKYKRRPYETQQAERIITEYHRQIGLQLYLNT